MGSQLSPLDKWVSNGNIYINKRYKQKIRFAATQNDDKMNDNLHMDSTISESMNARS